MPITEGEELLRPPLGWCEDKELKDMEKMKTAVANWYKAMLDENLITSEEEEDIKMFLWPSSMD